MLKPLSEEDFNEIYGISSDPIAEQQQLPEQVEITPQSMASATPEPQMPPEESKGILGTAFDVVKGVLSGPIKEVENTIQAGRDVADLVDNKFLDGDNVEDNKKVEIVPDFMAPETQLGKAAQAVSAFATGWVSMGRLISMPLKGLKGVAKVAQAMPRAAKATSYFGKDYLLGFINEDGSSENLANVLQENGYLNRHIAQYLAADPDDPWAENRAKGALIGTGLGVMTDLAMGVFRGVKASWLAERKGDIDAALAARKEAAEKLGTEGASALPSTYDEAVAQEWDKIKDLAKPDLNKLTPQAQRQIVAKEVIADPKGYLAAARKYFNTDNLQDAKVKALIDTYQDDLGETLVRDVPTLLNTHLDGIEYLVSHNADEAFDKNWFLSTGELNGVDAVKATGRRYAALDYAVPRHLERIAQAVKDQDAGALEEARNMTEAVLEIVADQKQAFLTASHTLNAARANSWFAETAGKYGAKGPQGHEMAENFAESVKKLVAEKSDDEITDFMEAVITASRNGEGSKEVMRLAALLTPAKSALRQQMKIPDNKLVNSLIRFRYFSMLSSLKTHLRAAIGSAAMVPIVSLEQGVKAMALGFMDGMEHGGATGALKGLKTGSTYGLYYQQGLLKALPQASRNFWNSLKYAEAIARPSKAVKDVQELGASYKWADNVITNYPFRLLQAVDEFFGTLTGTAKAYQDAMITMRRQDFLKNVPKELRADIAAKYVDNFMQNSFMDVTMKDGTKLHGGLARADSVRIAEDVAFQQALEGSLGKLNSFINSSILARTIMPFVRTPVNITKAWTVTRNPFFQFFGVGKAIKSGNKEAIAEAMANLTSGVILWGGAFGLAASGKITGEGPKDREQRDMLYQLGWRPLSYRSEDGSYTSLNALEPYGSVLGFFATMFERAQREGLDTYSIGNIAHALKIAVVDKSFMKGLSDLMLNIERDKAGDWATDIPVSFVPGILRDFGMATDPVRRAYGDDFFTRALGRTPWKDELAPQYSWLTGMPQFYGDATGLGPFLDFMNTSEIKSDIVVEELSRVPDLAGPTGKIGNHKLTDREQAIFNAEMGNIEIGGMRLWEALAAEITSEEYQNLREQYPDPNDFSVAPERAERLNNIVTEYRKAAQNAFLRKYPHIARESGYKKYLDF